MPKPLKPSQGLKRRSAQWEDRTHGVYRAKTSQTLSGIETSATSSQARAKLCAKTSQTLSGIETSTEKLSKLRTLSAKTSQTLSGIETEISLPYRDELAGAKTSQTLSGIETGILVVASTCHAVPKPLKPSQGLKLDIVS